jgi:transcriptional regulator with PAS, ATPase and Fis domain
LTHYLLGKLSRSLKKRIESISPEVIHLFLEYHWPGNVRQLSNTIERAILLEDTRMIRHESVSLPDVAGPAAQLPPPPASLKLSDDQEKQLIFQALEDNLWIQKDAAKQLGISPRALNYRIKKYGIVHARWRKHK